MFALEFRVPESAKFRHPRCANTHQLKLIGNPMAFVETVELQIF